MGTGRSTKQGSARAATWAGDEMTLKPASMTARRGHGAFGRDLHERATSNRSRLDPPAVAGQWSPVRQVGLPGATNEQQSNP